jgi:hypothetical protein
MTRRFRVRRAWHSPGSPAAGVGATVEALENRALLSVAPAAIEANITGRVFHDRNVDGVRWDSEQPIFAGLAYVDLDRNGVRDATEPSAVSSGSNGTFTLVVPAAGTYAVRVEPPRQYFISTPAGGVAEVTVGPGGIADAGDFGVYTNAYFYGKLYEEVTGNTYFDGADRAVPGAFVYADLNENSVPDAGDPSAAPDPYGSYALVLPPAKTYTIRASLPAGYVRTMPSFGDSYTATLDSSAGAYGDFISYRPATLEGALFQDLDIDGVLDRGEGGLVGRRVFADLDHDGVRDTGEPATLSRALGRYVLKLRPGTYEIRQDVPAGWTGTTTVRALTLASNGRAVQNLGSRAVGRVSGLVFEDADADGVRDAGETLVAGGTAYLDANNNGALDAGERSFPEITADGFWFDDAPVGSYAVRLLAREGWRQTLPAAGAGVPVTVVPGGSAGSTFGVAYVPTPNSIAGLLFDDRNGNTVRDGADGDASLRTVYLDANDNGRPDPGEPQQRTSATGAYRFLGLAPGTYHVRQVLPAKYAQTTPLEEARTVVLGAGEIVAGQDFGSVLTSGIGRFHGTYYDDSNRNGIMDDGEPRIWGAVVDIDLNDDGIGQAVEPGAVTAPDGVYDISPNNGQTGIVPVRAIVIDGYEAGNPSSAKYYVNTPAQDNHVWRNFGMVRKGTWVTGTAFNDLDRDGVRDAGEPGLSDAMVFADANGNWKLDDGEHYAVTAADGTYTLRDIPTDRNVRLRIDPRGDFAQTLPAGRGSYDVSGATGYTLFPGRDFGVDASAPGGAVAGYVFYDIGRDGVRTTDPGMSDWWVYADLDGDHVLDGNEPRTTAGPVGNYYLGDLAPGTYTVRAEIPPSYNQTTPTSNAGYAVTLAAGQLVNGKGFGVKEKVEFRGSIAGQLFNDADADGVKDASESALANWRVFIDDDKDGVLDSWETSVTTDAAGNYRFGNLANGNHRIRPVIQSGWRPTTPPVGYYDMPQTTDTITEQLDFLLTQKAQISGVVFTDADGDGTRDGGETGLSAWRIYIDADNDGVFDSTEKSVLTDASGNWTLGNLSAGTYRVRVVQQTGWARTTPTSGSYSVTVAAGASSTGNAFGERRP